MESDADGWAIVLARAAHIAACASLLGCTIVGGWIAAPSARARRDLRRFGALAALAVLLTGAAWLLLQAADMADASPDWPTVAEVLRATTFGQALTARLGLTLLCVMLAWAGSRAGAAAGAANGRGMPGIRCARLATPAAAASVATLAATGHGYAEASAPLTLALIAHALAASAWLGALAPFRLVLSKGGLAAARRFSWLGFGCVALLCASAIAQAPLIGAWVALIGTGFGQVIVLKICIFALLLLCALSNLRAARRRTDQPGQARALKAMRRLVLVETALGGGAILAASWLLQLAPGAHQDVDWPFAWRPSLAALADPSLATELLGTIPMLLAAAGLAALGLAAAPLCLACLGVAAALLWWTASSLSLLFVPAYPTSYYRSTSGFTAASVLTGAKLSPGLCAGCHGMLGRGDGKLAAGMDDPPADLMAGHLWDHADGELFWWLGHGMRDARGRLVMPGFAASLSEDELWALIDFIRARNAGLAMPATGADPIWIERRIEALGLRGRAQTGGHHVHHAASS